MTINRLLPTLALSRVRPLIFSCLRLSPLTPITLKMTSPKSSSWKLTLVNRPCLYRLLPVIFFLSLVFSVDSAKAEVQKTNAKPLWEIGMGAASFNLPDYPGSNHFRQKYLALPYGVYRGEVLRADDSGGLRGRIFKSPNMELSLSASGSFPANSSENTLREGMPDLDWLGEIGPRLIYYFIRIKKRQKLYVDLPVRLVLSTDFRRTVDRGTTLHPSLNFVQRGLLGNNFSIFARIGLLWASERLHDYFYEISPEFVTAQRPLFSAREGVLATRVSLAIGIDLAKDIRFFLGSDLDSYANAKNRLSPLHERTHSINYGVGFVWSLYQSEQLTTSDW